MDGTFCKPEIENCGKNFTIENEPRLLIRIPSRDSFLLIQTLERHLVSADPNVKEWMPLRDGLHEMMQCYRRQHFVASNDLQKHPRKTFIVERIYEDEIHEHSDGINKDAIRIK